MSTMQQKRATWALLLMTCIWGYTFIWIKSALNAGDRLLGAEALPITVGLFMVIRFLGAALILPMALPAARERLTDPAVWRAGGVLSFFVLAGFLLQMFGMHGIDSATSAFLTSLYVVFTAIALAAWTRTLPSKTLIIGIACATLGAPLLGDVKYGAPSPLSDKSVALHARSLELDHPTRSERLRFELDSPKGEPWRGFDAAR